MSKEDLAKAVTESIMVDKLSNFPDTSVEGNGYKSEPHEDRKIDDRLITYHRPRSLQSEYFRFLKSKIEHHFDDPPDRTEGRIILVTGASLGSGKTTCSLNLALSFASAYGNRVLFLDGDTRNNTAKKYLGIHKNPLPGLSNVLTQHLRAGETLINTGLSDLIFFPSGEFSEGFVDRVRSRELAILLGSLKKRFRFIIIDTPPAFPMPESGIIAQHCDGALIVLRAGKDGMENLEQTQEALGDTEILGVLLNGVSLPPGQKYGAYGYYGKAQR